MNHYSHWLRSLEICPTGTCANAWNYDIFWRYSFMNWIEEPQPLLADILGGTAWDCDYCGLLIYFCRGITGTFPLQITIKLYSVIFGKEAIIAFAWAKQFQSTWQVLQNHRVLEFERDLWRSFSPASQPNQGHLDLDQLYVQRAFEYLQEIYPKSPWATCTSDQPSSEQKHIS